MSNVITKQLTVLAGATTNLFTYTIPDGYAVFGFTVTAVARASTGGVDEAAHYETKFSVKRFNSGTPTMIGSPVPIVVNEDDAGWGLNISLSGSEVIIDFVGDAAASVQVQGELMFIRRPS